VSAGGPLSSSERFKARAIAVLVSPIVASLCHTVSWTAEGTENYDEILRSGRQPIMTFWHGRILGGLDYFRHRRIVVMTSQNFDGEWIAGIIERFGYGTARGSTSRGGARALVQLRRDLVAGRPAAFTIDGPRGPARVAQPGAVFLAGATGHPLVPFHIEANRFWTAGRWDRTQVPKPFARVSLAVGEPMFVPDTNDDTIERSRVALEQALVELERRAFALLAPDGSRMEKKLR